MTEGSAADVEQGTAPTAFPKEELRHENAKWWRWVNRIMSVLGIIVIAVVVVLAVVFAKM